MATTTSGPRADTLAASPARPRLLPEVPTQRTAHGSVLVEAPEVQAEDLLGAGPVPLSAIVAAALPELTAPR